ncbi:MAG TPA: enoyl-CoA hydratase-related protein [Haliangium sp.]|nr:enoyl-CoA hydratase-related protein [Haliangium sp.]
MQSQSVPASYTTIDYDDTHVPVARITLNRADKRNPIGPLTIGELMHAFEAVRENEAARVVILTGAGSAFSAGGDLGAFSGTTEPTRSPIRPRSLVELFPAMHALGKPIIAMVNGPAMGGGLGLMTACDVVVASDEATFGLPEIKVGLWPMMIMSEIVRNVGRKAALDLMLSGRHFQAQEALALGLVTRVVPHERLEAETMAMARAIAAHSPATIALGLRAFYDYQGMELEAGLAYLEKELGKVLALEDAKEGIMAFLQKRKPEWKGR